MGTGRTPIACSQRYSVLKKRQGDATPPTPSTTPAAPPAAAGAPLPTPVESTALVSAAGAHTIYSPRGGAAALVGADGSALNGMEAVSAMLGHFDLPQYASKFEEEGYDDVEYLCTLDGVALAALAQAVSMKPGHAQKLCSWLPKLTRVVPE